MEVEKPAEEFSKEDLRRQLYSSLRSTGVLDSMKGQLRARLLEHLRHHNGEAIEVKRKPGKPSLTERLLSSLFLDYLECHGFTFTISVFMPESQMASWRPFAYHEMLELLHLDPSSDLHIHLKIGGEGRECLAHQLVTLLQRMAQRNCITEVSTQTSPAAAAAEVCKLSTRSSCTSPKDIEKSMKEVEDAYIRKQEAQRALPYRSLEDKITVLHQEFDARVNAEVALQVSRLRDYEINAARMDEAARYRRQLARDREELEDIHKARMDRIKAREESLLERMLSKEKAIEASAYEQRQKILTEITGLRDRENKLRLFKESQERREEKLDEKELSIRAKEEEVVRVRNTLYAQADEITALRRKELEEQHKELCDRLQHDRTLLGAEREQMKEEKIAMAIEIASSRSDKELIKALHHRLRVEEEQRLNLIKTTRELEATLDEKLRLQRSSAPTPVNIPDQRLEGRLRELQSEFEQERLQRQACEKERKTLERKLQQKKVELAAVRAPQVEWIAEHKNLMATIHQQDVELQKKETKLQLMEIDKDELTARHKKLLLKIDHADTRVKEAQAEKDRAIYDLEILQDQHKTTERELLETVTLLRKAKQALENERLDHCSLQSHKKSFVPSMSLTPQRVCISQDRHEQSNSLFETRPTADEIIRKKWDSFRKKPRRESQDLWTHVLSDNAAKKLCQEQGHVYTPVDNFQISSFPQPFSSGFGSETQNHDSLIESDGKPTFWKTDVEFKRSEPSDINGWKAMTMEELSTGNGGISSLTRRETLLTGTSSIGDLYTSSWDGERTCEDAIPSWRKTPALPEMARSGCWRIDFEQPESKAINTKCQDDFDISVSSVTRGPENAWKPGHRGDRSQPDGPQGQISLQAEAEEKMAPDYDFQEALSSSQCFETTGENHTLQIRSFSATSIGVLRNSEEEMQPVGAHFKSAKMTVRDQRDPAILSTSEIKSQGGLSSVCTRDIFVPENPLRIRRPEAVPGHTPPLETKSAHSDLDCEDLRVSESVSVDRPSFSTTTMRHVMVESTREGYENQGSKEQDDATSKDGREETDTIAQEVCMTSDIQASIRNADFKKESKSPRDAEEHIVNSQPDEKSPWERTNLEPPEHIGILEEPLTKHETDASGLEGADNPWRLYLGEEEADTREDSEGEESWSQDTTPSCKCLASLKRELESLDEAGPKSTDELLISGPPLDSQSESEQRETGVEETSNIEMNHETDIVRLSTSAQNVDTERLECADNSEAAEDKSKQAKAEDEARETDPVLLLPSDPEPCESLELADLTSEVQQVAMDLTALASIPTHSEEKGSTHSPTLSISDGDSAQDPDKDFNKLMRCLGLTDVDDEQQEGSKEEAEPMCREALSLNSRIDDLHENSLPASGKMSGLPEMGEMLYKQEQQQQAREKNQTNVPGKLLQDSAQAPSEKVEVHDRSALETLRRTSIVMRKQELSETGKESPRLVGWMSTSQQKSHPTLALAIRNNRLVKLGKQDEVEQTPRSSFLNRRYTETTKNPNSTPDEKERLGKETSCFFNDQEKSSNKQHTSESIRTPRRGEIHSSSEESIYQGDSFEDEEEEEEEEGDLGPGFSCSEESCTSAVVGEASDQAPDLERSERSSPRSAPNFQSKESRSNIEKSPANWEGESD